MGEYFMENLFLYNRVKSCTHAKSNIKPVHFNCGLRLILLLRLPPNCLRPTMPSHHNQHTERHRWFRNRFLFTGYLLRFRTRVLGVLELRVRIRFAVW